MTAVIPSPASLPSLIEGLPNICGWETDVEAAMQGQESVFLSQTNLRLSNLSAGFAIALHMHQPTIPAGVQGELICNLQYMFEHPYEGDNHDAAPFAYCYARMGDFIPELVEQGCNPRAMLDYSGTLLWGLQQMGRQDILDKLQRITCDPAYQPYVEWLGTFWGHAVAASTPLPDMKLHLQAWQHHFMATFGREALSRVRGFSPPEMQLPNHPEVLYQLVTALKECGYRWMLVQEHTVETLAGRPIQQPHLPHRLVARSATGATAEIPVLVKTQGSDTKLVGQMQPYYEAKTLQPVKLGGHRVPPLVSQIADGENGGVMMNEFPSAFKRACHEISSEQDSRTVGINGTEYLELLAAEGVTTEQFPTCQAVGQAQLWQRLSPEAASPEAVAATIAAIKSDDPSFQMDGGSWTNDRSWVQGYENVMQPLENLSQRFHSAIAALSVPEQTDLTRQHRYRNALLHNLLLQTSCFRYWGQGAWTDHAREIYRRGLAILDQDFS
ncbi:glycosyl hydrolase family 57 [Romeria aff. gracilis LEGE 07310]|uniref:Glycosyl hydrolase family 57 n=1 Tax=Vasconcelosia minhoensis LEGE 07310 TaxID=915328 RepID=A0A8J7ALF9_9CYAN|nr:glycosyl hydrolase family 57 [Romeria gracilis]MBE9080038.1 glycosyl hydrolase family 57 [Romeria aff. gracilis LEGE 07310]